jgi:hypothetical protein
MGLAIKRALINFLVREWVWPLVPRRVKVWAFLNDC